MQSAQQITQNCQNPNLMLSYEPQYRGLPVLANQERPLIVQYLDGILDTVDEALWHYPRITAFLFVLKLPTGYPLGETDNSPMTRFWKSLNAKIRANRSSARKRNVLVHDTGVFFVWAREYDSHETAPHWHCALMVNQDAYSRLGWSYSDQENMWHRIHSAWASALGLHVSQVQGLVHFPDNETYYINRNSGGEDKALLFRRLSYLAKAPTKVYHDNIHAFGCSRSRRPGSSSRWGSCSN